MFKLSIKILALMCVGCIPPSQMNYSKGEYLCRNNGGLYLFSPVRQYPVLCADGTQFDVQTVNNLIIKDPKYLPKRSD